MKRGAPNDEDGGGTNKKVPPIPRTLGEQSVTLHFTRRTWEICAPGQLKYLPLSQTPHYMITPAERTKFDRFKNSMWSTMEILDVNAKMSNFIMLQDDLRVQNNTPTDATAFTQVCYLIHFIPTKMTEYFKLGKIVNLKNYDYVTNTYNFKEAEDVEKTERQLLDIQGYEDFNKLCVIPAHINENAGFNPNSGISLDPIDPKKYSVIAPYIPPNSTLELSKASCNLQPIETGGQFYMKQLDTSFKATNLDVIKLYKYGDEVHLPIVTNLEGVPLMNVEQNDISQNTPITQAYGAAPDPVDIATYQTEFIWPGPNRPFYSRADNLYTASNVITKNKQFQRLRHHFFTMPPIYKPNGALLGQRCSFVLEQNLVVRFNTTESIHNIEEAEDVLKQKDAVIIRPALYGAIQKEGEESKSPFCGIGLQRQCKMENTDENRKWKRTPTAKALECPSDSWNGIDIVLGQISPTSLSNIFTLHKEKSSNIPSFSIKQLTITNIENDAKITDAWYKNIGSEGLIQFEVTEPEVGEEFITYGHFGTTDVKNYIRRRKLTGQDPYKYIILHCNNFQSVMASKYNMTCTVSALARAAYKNTTYESTVFFS